MNSELAELISDKHSPLPLFSAVVSWIEERTSFSAFAYCVVSYFDECQMKSGFPRSSCKFCAAEELSRKKEAWGGGTSLVDGLGPAADFHKGASSNYRSFL